MSWLQEPKVSTVRAQVAAGLRRKEYQFRTLGPVVFLCGAENSQPRDRLKAYLERYHRACHVFYAENVWDVIVASEPNANALEVEERLANLSDVVVVIVESAGTFAEVGAFAISRALRRKLLPILEARFQHEPSFLRSGPVHWVDQDSQFAPSIWLTQDRILEGAREIDERLSRVPAPEQRAVPDRAQSPKHLLFFICDVVAVFGPCSADDVLHLVIEILDEEVDVGFYLGLGLATGLLQSLQFEGEEIYLRPLLAGRLPAFHRTKKFVDIPTLRARMIGAIQISARGRRALVAASRGNDAPT